MKHLIKYCLICEKIAQASPDPFIIQLNFIFAKLEKKFNKYFENSEIYQVKSFFEFNLKA